MEAEEKEENSFAQVSFPLALSFPIHSGSKLYAKEMLMLRKRERQRERDRGRERER